jgi:hypothetical protein
MCLKAIVNDYSKELYQSLTDCNEQCALTMRQHTQNATLRSHDASLVRHVSQGRHNNNLTIIVHDPLKGRQQCPSGLCPVNRHEDTAVSTARGSTATPIFKSY